MTRLYEVSRAQQLEDSDQRHARQGRLRQLEKNITRHQLLLQKYAENASLLPGPPSRRQVAVFREVKFQFPRLQEKDKRFFSESIHKAKAAISACDITALQLSLGPSLYDHHYQFYSERKKNRWEWFSTLSWHVLRVKNIVIQAFLMSEFPNNQLPPILTVKQQIALRERLITTLTTTEPYNVLAITATLGAEPGAEGIKQYLSWLFQREVKRIQNNAICYVDQLWETDTQTQSKYLQSIERQSELNAAYQKRGWEDAEWTKFCESIKKVRPNVSEDEINRLRASGISSLSLGIPEGTALFNQALDSYLRAGLNKSGWLPIIDVLFQHGCMPSYDRLEQFDLILLERMLQYLDAPTHLAEEMRKIMLSFCQSMLRPSLLTTLVYIFTDSNRQREELIRFVKVIHRYQFSTVESSIVDTELADVVIQHSNDANLRSEWCSLSNRVKAGQVVTSVRDVIERASIRLLQGKQQQRAGEDRYLLIEGGDERSSYGALEMRSLRSHD